MRDFSLIYQAFGEVALWSLKINTVKSPFLSRSDLMSLAVEFIPRSVIQNVHVASATTETIALISIVADATKLAEYQRSVE